MIILILHCAAFFVIIITLLCVMVSFYKPKSNSSAVKSILQADINTIPVNAHQEDTRLKAVVLSSPDKKFKYKKFDYIGHKDCNIFKKFYDSPNECARMCFGYGSCKAFCPEDAIIIKNKTAVVTKSCIGCGKCVSSCPNHLIQLFPIDEKDIVQCANEDLNFKNCSACKNCRNEG